MKLNVPRQNTKDHQQLNLAPHFPEVTCTKLQATKDKELQIGSERPPQNKSS